MDIRVGDSPPSGFEALADAEIFTHGHLPVAAAYCRRLGVVELVDRMVPTRMEISPGLVVQAMILDTLSGRSPLYRLEEFMAGQDVGLLLGESVSPGALNDNNVGRSLDAIFAAGTSTPEHGRTSGAWRRPSPGKPGHVRNTRRPRHR